MPIIREDSFHIIFFQSWILMEFKWIYSSSCVGKANSSKLLPCGCWCFCLGAGVPELLPSSCITAEQTMHEFTVAFWCSGLGIEFSSLLCVPSSLCSVEHYFLSSLNLQTWFKSAFVTILSLSVLKMHSQAIICLNNLNKLCVGSSLCWMCMS